MPSKASYRKHPEHFREYQKKWQAVHRDKVNKAQRDRHRAHREQVIKLYGGRCVCCGESAYEFLAIDHVHGGGTQERKAKWPNSQSFYRWLKDNYKPDMYRILCHNCNSATGYYGYCPHEKERKCI